MPTYEYLCEDCGCNFEIVQSFHDDALTDCPDCEKKSLRRVIFAAHVYVRKSETNPSMTLGHLASRNRDRMSDDQKESIRRKQAERQGKKEQKELPKGMKRIEPTVSPFEGTEPCPATRKEIQKMDAKQKDNYIRTGQK